GDRGAQRAAGADRGPVDGQPAAAGAQEPVSLTTKNAGGAGVSGPGRAGLFLLDEEILDLLALGDLGRQPARLLAAAGPGFRRVGGVAIFRRHLAELAPGGLLGRFLRRRRGPADGGTAAEQFLDGIALGRGEIDDPL